MKKVGLLLAAMVVAFSINAQTPEKKEQKCCEKAKTEACDKKTEEAKACCKAKADKKDATCCKDKAEKKNASCCKDKNTTAATEKKNK